MKKGSSLLIAEPMIPVLPSLAARIGLNEAIFLQQVHFWLEKSAKVVDGRKWIYNSTSAWRKQFPFWCERTIKNIVKSLREKGLILTANHNAARFDKTLWYTIEYDALAKLETESGRAELLPGGQGASEGGAETGHSRVQDLPEEDAALPSSYRAGSARAIPEKENSGREEMPEESGELPFEPEAARSAGVSSRRSEESGEDRAYGAWHRAFFAHWDAEYRRSTQGERYRFEGGREGALLKRSGLYAEPPDEVFVSIRAFLGITEKQDRYVANNRTIGMFVRSWNHRLLAQARAAAREGRMASHEDMEAILAEDEEMRARQACGRGTSGCC